MGQSASSTIFFGIFLGSGSEHFHRLEDMYSAGTLPEKAEDEEEDGVPEVAVEYVYDEPAFRIGIELHRGDWDSPLEISLEKLQAVNTAVNVEAIRLLCVELGIPFTEPKLLLTSSFS